jgi:hypothetical protein
MKKRNPSSGQNDQLVHWWLLIHSGRLASTKAIWLLDVIFSLFFLHVPIAKQIFLVQSGYFSP